MLQKNKIGLRNQHSLHSQIKEWYAQPGDKFEVEIDGFIVDIVRNDLLIEVQTKNFSAIRKKLRHLVRNHPLRLVYPLPQEKYIVHVDEKNGSKILSRRRSPKKGNLLDLFDELIRIPDLFNNKNFSLEVLMIKEKEVRCKNGKGSWRRRGVSIKDRKLLEVVASTQLEGKQDFLNFLPSTLPQPFSNKNLAQAHKIPAWKARFIAYCLKKMGAVVQVGKRGNEQLFTTS